ncbi:hypothetical protein GF325_05535 [Candidatus Bathyarchaeota archaeon]|nr:hypothetical protein [Candidatus Bathyarchaeota archaeon]
MQDLNQRQLRNGAVANLAIDKNAILITVDSDFLDLKKNIQEQARIIYVKVHPSIPENILELIENNLESCIKDLKEPGTILLTPGNYNLERIS